MPEAWQGNLLTNDFRGNRVCRFVLSDDGAGFAAREQAELIKTKHVAFRPIDVKMGPDGAIYIADWYNPIIQHGEVDFRDPRRDHTHGRIWRVTAKGRPLVPRPRAGRGDRPRRCSRRSRPPKTGPGSRPGACSRSAARRRSLPALASWVTALDPQRSRVRAPSPRSPLDLPGARRRRAGDCSRAAPTRPTRASGPRPRGSSRSGRTGWPIRVALLGERVADEDPRVRLEAVRALARIPEPALGRAGAGGARSAGRHVPRIRPVADGARARAALAARGPGRPVRFRRPARNGWSSPCRRSARPTSSSRFWPCCEQGEGPDGPGRERADPDRHARRPGRAGGGARSGRCRRGARPSRDAAALLDTAGPGGPSGGRSSRRGTCRRIGRSLASGDDALRAAALRAVGAWNVASLQGRLVELAARRGHARRRSAPRRSRRWSSRAGPRGGGSIEALAERGAVAGGPGDGAGRARWKLDPKAATPRIVAWLGRLPPDRVGEARDRAGRVPGASRRRRPRWPRAWTRAARPCPPIWPSSASARSAPRAATSPP